MNGRGCKTCPVKPCHTLHYRGSYCAEQRAKFSLGDPKTNSEKVQTMSVGELKDSILAVQLGYRPWCDYHCKNDGDDGCDKCIEKWLNEPAEVDNGQSNDQK